MIAVFAVLNLATSMCAPLVGKGMDYDECLYEKTSAINKVCKAGEYQHVCIAKVNKEINSNNQGEKDVKSK